MFRFVPLAKRIEFSTDLRFSYKYDLQGKDSDRIRRIFTTELLSFLEKQTVEELDETGNGFTAALFEYLNRADGWQHDGHTQRHAVQLSADIHLADIKDSLTSNAHGKALTGLTLNVPKSSIDELGYFNVHFF